jgi:hypothetical protein
MQFSRTRLRLLYRKHNNQSSVVEAVVDAVNESPAEPDTQCNISINLVSRCWRAGKHATMHVKCKASSFQQDR